MNCGKNEHLNEQFELFKLTCGNRAGVNFGKRSKQHTCSMSSKSGWQKLQANFQDSYDVTITKLECQLIGSGPPGG